MNLIKTIRNKLNRKTSSRRRPQNMCKSCGNLNPTSNDLVFVHALNKVQNAWFSFNCLVSGLNEWTEWLSVTDRVSGRHSSDMISRGSTQNITWQVVAQCVWITVFISIYCHSYSLFSLFVFVFCLPCLCSLLIHHLFLLITHSVHLCSV